MAEIAATIYDNGDTVGSLMRDAEEQNGSETPEADVSAYLRECEEHLFRPEVRSDPAQVRKLLHPSFQEFGASGRVYTRDLILAALHDEVPGKISLRDFAARPLAIDVYLVTYLSQRDDVDGSTQEALRSSIWRRDQEGWRMLFHQGTRTTRGR